MYEEVKKESVSFRNLCMMIHLELQNAYKYVISPKYLRLNPNDIFFKSLNAQNAKFYLLFTLQTSATELFFTLDN